MIVMVREGKIDFVIGCEEEICCVVCIFFWCIKNNLVFIGEFGVGKMIVVEGFVQWIVNNDVFDNFVVCKLFFLDVGVLVVGSKYRGEFEECMKGVLKEIQEFKEMIVLFVDEIYFFMGVGLFGEGGMDVVNLFKFMFVRGQFYCIGVIILVEYCKYIEKDVVFECCFQ